MEYKRLDGTTTPAELRKAYIRWCESERRLRNEIDELHRVEADKSRPIDDVYLHRSIVELCRAKAVSYKQDYMFFSDQESARTSINNTL